MSARPHEYEQIDQGQRYCLHCPATGEPDDPLFCVETSMDNRQNSVTLPRELDSIARQLMGIAERLKRLKTA